MGTACCKKDDVVTNDEVPASALRPRREDASEQPEEELLDGLEPEMVKASSDGCVLDMHQRRGSTRRRTRNSMSPPVLDGDDHQTCCVAWSVSLPTRLTERELLEFHEHVQSCCQLFGVEVLTRDATCGLIPARSPIAIT